MDTEESIGGRIGITDVEAIGLVRAEADRTGEPMGKIASKAIIKYFTIRQSRIAGVIDESGTIQQLPPANPARPADNGRMAQT